MSTRRSARKSLAPAKYEAGPASTYETGDGLILFPNSPAPKKAAKTPVKKSTAKKPAAKTPVRKTPAARSKTPTRKSTAKKPAKVVEEPEEEDEDDEDDEDHEEGEDDEDDEDDHTDDEEEEPEPKIQLQDESDDTKPTMLMDSTTAITSMVLVGALNAFLSSADAQQKLGPIAYPAIQAFTFLLVCALLTNMLRTLVLTTDFDDLLLGTTDAKTGMAGIGMMIAMTIVAYTNFTIIALTTDTDEPFAEPALNEATADHDAQKATDDVLNMASMSKNDVIAAQIFVYVFSMLSILAVIYMVIENENFEDITFSKPRFNSVGEEDADSHDEDDDEEHDDDEHDDDEHDEESSDEEEE
jgi:hypothetical protein